MTNQPTTDATFVDLEIRIFQQQDAGYPIEITLGGQQEFPRGYLSAGILPWVPSGDLAADGQRLFETLLADPALRSAWAEARGQAPQRRIRLRIDTAAAELHALPWELLHEGPAMLSAQAGTPFSRYLPIALPWGGSVEERPIRVLVLVSDPADIETKYGLPRADVELERTTLESAFGSVNESVDPGELQVDFFEPPVTPERLEDQLRAGDGYHILHYLGHGAFSAKRGQAVLYVQDDDGNTRLLFDHELAQLLARQGVQPRLVFLAACQSATRSTADAFLGMAPRLVSVGVPAVVAMQELVTVESALKFSGTFYRRLLEHGLVDQAVNEARSTLLTAGRPDAAVPALFMRFKSGQLWETEAEFEFPPPPQPTPPPSVTGFVGREAELTYFAEKLVASRLAVITGMPGVGKTTLAAVLAQQVTNPGQIFWHTFHDGEGVDAIVWKLAGFLFWRGQKDLWRMLQGVQQGSGQPPPPEMLFDYLIQMMCGQRYLFCFDDFQFMDDGPDGDPLPAQLVERLHQAVETGELSLVIISQHTPSFVRSDEFKVLTGLSLKDTLEFFAHHGLPVPQAQELPSRMYTSIELSSMKDLMSADLVANLHARTGGNAQLLTLAIDAFERTFTPARLLIRMFEVDDIERFLMEEIDENLTEDERAVMSAVAVLLGYAGTRDAIETVLDGENVRRTLRGLSQRHLLNVNHGETGRGYSMNSVMRHFYYDLLSKRERQAMHRRAGEYYETEEPDILKAARHFERAGEYEQAAWLATDDIWALVNQGQSRPLRQLLERFTARQLDPAQWAMVNIARGQVCALLGEAQSARGCYQEALSGLAALPDSPEARVLKARACQGMGDSLQFESSSKALDWLRRGLDELAGASAQEQEEAALHIRIGNIQIDMGEFTAALHSLEQGLSLLPESPSRLRATALLNLGNIHASRGNMEQSSEYTRQALEISEQLYDYFRMAAIWHNMGIDHEIAGQWDEATIKYQEALALADQLGSVERQAGLELSLGIVNMKQGQDKVAKTHLANCLTLARDHNLKMYLVWGNSSLADLHLRQGEPKVAASLLAGAERLVLELDTKEPLPEIYREWAQAHLASADPQAALTYAERSVNLAGELDMKIEQGISLRVLGQALIANGQHEPAVDAFQQSLSLLANRDPYEAARTKMEWGRHLTSGSDPEQGTLMLKEARATFQELGAQRDLAAADKVLRCDS